MRSGSHRLHFFLFPLQATIEVEPPAHLVTPFRRFLPAAFFLLLFGFLGRLLLLPLLVFRLAFPKKTKRRTTTRRQTKNNNRQSIITPRLDRERERERWGWGRDQNLGSTSMLRAEKEGILIQNAVSTRRRPTKTKPVGVFGRKSTANAAFTF